MSENINERGGISVQTEHIFPIIKKWLYSEKEIFLREIVSNACDAVTKLRRLISLGQVKDIDPSEFCVNVIVNKDAKTITVSDNGIGMTADEVRSYICQIALSGALDFIEKYEGESSDNAPGIIGHFGLGFYSSFMVADTVELETRSYTDAAPVKWVCSEDGDYEISSSDKETRGTDVIMHVTDDEAEFLESAKLREILDKYCAFMPVEIYFDDGEEPACTCGAKEGEECTCDKTPHPINDTHPLWQKNASDCTDEEYNEFYNKLFPGMHEPLFHIHLAADYPLNFRGILYFPRLRTEFDNLEGQVKLYYNQVFVADNIKEVIPDYLLMLRGVLDCPELPLNVSRSYLQNSSYVQKISAHITKKVADKLCGMMNTDREKYESLWEDLKLFVEYGCMRDRKFYDRMKGALLLPLTDGKCVTIDEYVEKLGEGAEKVIYYTNDKVAQAQYISLYNAQGIDVVVFDRVYDTQYMNMLEHEKQVKFLRVDSDVAGALKGDGEVWESAELVELFKKVSGNSELKVKYEILKDISVPAILNISEQTRRLEDMMKLYRMRNENKDDDMRLPMEATLVLNSSSDLIRTLAGTLDEAVARQLWSLALLSQRHLDADELKAFLADSFAMLEKAAKNG